MKRKEFIIGLAITASLQLVAASYWAGGLSNEVRSLTERLGRLEHVLIQKNVSLRKE